MTIGFLTSNPTFSAPLIAELDRRGHVIVYTHSQSAEENAFQIGQLHERCDRFFVDWAQPPLEQVLATCSPLERPTFCRAHRIEMYCDQYIQQVPWNHLEGLFFVGQHVQDRFLSKVGNPPKRIINLGHVGIDAEQWSIDADARKWEPPYRIVLAGNIVPKKRVYTAVQLLADLPEQFSLSIHGNGGRDGYGNPEYHINVQDLIEELGIGHRIECSGSLPQDDLREVFQRSHFVLSASNEEGCHTSVAEGMACGCVPLCNAWRGVREVYPPEWVWQTPKQLYALLKTWDAMPLDEKTALPDAMRAAVLPKYDARLLAAKVCDVVTGPLTAATVGEYYSTTMLDQMTSQDGNARQANAAARALELLQNGGRCLEIGCGTGYLSRTLQAEAGIHCVGQDLARGLLEFAMEHNEHGAEFVRADATQHLVNGPHDLITLVDVLEHIPAHKHEGLFARCRHHLADGGAILLRFPWQVQDKQIIEEKCHPKLVRRMLRARGFEIESYQPVDIANEYFEIVARKGAA